MGFIVGVDRAMTGGIGIHKVAIFVILYIRTTVCFTHILVITFKTFGKLIFLLIDGGITHSIISPHFLNVY